MKTMSIDIETFSPEPLSECGVYRYCESPDFQILLFAYSVDEGPVQQIDLASGESLPEEIQAALLNPNVIKWAFNAQFERVCLSRWLGYPTGHYLNPDSWRCSMVWAASLSLPLSLENAGEALGLEKQKLKEGKELVRWFCTPAETVDGTCIRRLPADDPEKWAQFCHYNRRDVEAELEIRKRLAPFPLPEEEWQHYHLDQRINDRGVLLDRVLVRQAVLASEQLRQAQLETARRITGLENPNSPAQLKAWLAEQGVEASSLRKKDVLRLMEDATGTVKQVLALRLELSKSSLKKYTAMEKMMCADGRARGLLQFWGASRTGRWSGRLIQAQNLPRNHISDLDHARTLLRSGQFDRMEAQYPSRSDVLSQLIRTAFIPKPGCRFFVADYSAIEARVLAWLAGEGWRQRVFAQGGDIYCASASKMFHVPVEKHGVNQHLRQKGKIAELALGYGGSANVLKAMGALEMGLQEQELQPLVNAWRSANPHIVAFWHRVERAAKTCIARGIITDAGEVRFFRQREALFLELPSGRRLTYLQPQLEQNRFGFLSITYLGLDSAKKWGRLESYGAKLVENIAQAIARDLLVGAMERLNALGFSIVMHVHDEVVIEAPAETSLEQICAILSQTPSWAKGLVLNAEGSVCNYYCKG